VTLGRVVAITRGGSMPRPEADGAMRMSCHADVTTRSGRHQQARGSVTVSFAIA
jgi:hypothetical protein